VFERRWQAADSHHSDHAHPLRRRVAVLIAVAALVAAMAPLLMPPRANGNFVYWTNETGTTIGRAKINGLGPNNSFISGLNDPLGVAVDSKFIYWSERGADRIGRANLDGSGVNPNFIPSASGVSNPAGVAVTPTHIFWANGSNTIGRANLDGTGPVANFITTTSVTHCGIGVDASFVYWTDTQNPSNTIGRAPLDGSGSDPNFITGISAECGVAADSSFLYWGADLPSVGRATIGGGGATNSFIPNAVPSGVPCGVAVNPQYIFWGNPTVTAIGRANLNGSSPNPTLVPGASIPCLLAAAPSNKITINSITRKKKKGTAIVNAKVPGPGQVTLSNTSTGQDVNATAAAVKQVGLTITGASSFKLPIKPLGKTKKKLNKQVKKKGKGKVKVKAFVTFVPAGVAGVPNSQPVKTKLIKQRRKKR
jgi:hypothetical protein